MSAAIGNLVEPSNEMMPVRDWLIAVSGGGGPDAAAMHERAAPPTVATVCSSAVAPLEIAAALEAAGLSQQAVQETTGHDDVFRLAEQLWRTVPYVEANVESPPCWRRGNIGDLGRGALYAAPALIIQGYSTAADVRFRWWTLPLAMTLGWAMGQLTAFGGYSMRARNDARGESRVTTLVFVLAIAVTAACAWGAQRAFGGDARSVVCATAITVYMVASSLLLLHEEQRLGALLLAPAAVASVAVLLDVPLGGSVAISAIIASGVGTLVAAGRHLGLPFVGRSSVHRSDLSLAAQHLMHGLMCGLALSSILLIGTHISDFSSHAAVTSVPLLLTLGVMEWRLRTFRADVETLARTLVAIDDFAGRAVRIFLRGLVVYVGAVVVGALVVSAALHRDGSPVPVTMLLAEVALAALYYVDLTLSSIGRLDVVMRAWTAAAITGGVLLALSLPFGVDALTAVWWSTHAGVWVALTILLGTAPRIIAAPCSH